MSRDPLERRRAKRHQSNTLPIALVAVGAAVILAGLLAVGGWFVFTRGGNGWSISGPSESREGVTWTLKELADHLRKNGLDVCLTSHDGKPYLIDSRCGDLEASLAMIDVENGAGWPTDGFLVSVQQCHDREIARHAAGRQEKGAFAWGGFLFYGAEHQLDRLRKVLR
jgi:hypothetical protein